MGNQETPGIGIVFGGGNGIGAACCRLMRERGWQVAVADFDEDGAQAVAREVDGLALRVDVRDAAFNSGAMSELLAKAISEKPDVLVVHNPTVQLLARQIKQAAASQALAVWTREHLVTIDASGIDASHIADAFRARFEALQKRCPLVQQIRVKGTMIGIELSIDGTPIVDACLKRQLLINCTHGNVLRLLPALNLPDDALQAGCDIMESVLLTHK